jgi:hypothetical protein
MKETASGGLVGLFAQKLRQLGNVHGDPPFLPCAHLVLQLLKQKAPFPPQLAVHFSAHDIAWAVGPDKTKAWAVGPDKTKAAMMVTPIMNDLRMVILPASTLTSIKFG